MPTLTDFSIEIKEGPPPAANQTRPGGGGTSAPAPVGGAGPAGTGTPGKRTPKERARLAALARWGKYKAKGKQPAGGKGKKPAATPEEKEAARRAEAQANRAKVGDELNAQDAPLSKSGLASIEALATGAEAPNADGLVSMGLAVKGEDGRYRLTAQGKKAYNEAGKGNVAGVLDAVSEANDKRPKPKDEKAPKEGEEGATPEEEKPAGGGGGGGGGGGKEDKETEKAEQQTASRNAIRDKMSKQGEGLHPDQFDMFLSFADGGKLSPKDAQRMRDLGLVEGDPPRLTGDGKALERAASSGDYRSAADAISQAAERVKKSKDDEKARMKADELRRARDRFNATVKARIDEYKAQSAQERAMFANMGGGRSGGGGGGGGGGGAGEGGKPTGGTGGLYAKDPKTGKRTPAAGLDKGAPPPPAGGERAKKLEAAQQGKGDDKPEAGGREAFMQRAKERSAKLEENTAKAGKLQERMDAIDRELATGVNRNQQADHKLQLERGRLANEQQKLIEANKQIKKEAAEDKARSLKPAGDDGGKPTTPTLPANRSKPSFDTDDPAEFSRIARREAIASEAYGYTVEMTPAGGTGRYAFTRDGVQRVFPDGTMRKPTKQEDAEIDAAIRGGRMQVDRVPMGGQQSRNAGPHEELHRATGQTAAQRTKEADRATRLQDARSKGPEALGREHVRQMRERADEAERSGNPDIARSQRRQADEIEAELGGGKPLAAKPQGKLSRTEAMAERDSRLQEWEAANPAPRQANTGLDMGPQTRTKREYSKWVAAREQARRDIEADIGPRMGDGKPPAAPAAKPRATSAKPAASRTKLEQEKARTEARLDKARQKREALDKAAERSQARTQRLRDLQAELSSSPSPARRKEIMAEVAKIGEERKADPVKGYELKISRRHSAADEGYMKAGMAHLTAARHAFQLAGAPDEDGDGVPDDEETKGIPEIGEDAHPGAMVCLVVPDELQELLEGLGGESPDHVTLCYLSGDADTLEDCKTDILEALTRIARTGAPVEGSLGGLARFNASPGSDGKDVLVALVDSPDLPHLHNALYEALENCDIDLPDEHGFIPHITLTYLDPEARTPNKQIPRVPVTFDALTLVWAGERIDLPFGDEGEDATPLMVGYPAVKDLPPAELLEEDDLAFAPIGAIKSFSGERLVIQGVKYGGRDLVDDEFTHETDLGFSRSPVGMPVYYDHAQRGIKSQIGIVRAFYPSDEGIDFEVELDRHNRYVETVKQLYAKRVLGGSTGAASHLVIREQGKLKRWIVAELSLTPTPAEPRTVPSIRDTKSLDTPETGTEAGQPADAGGALDGLVIKAISTINTLRLAQRIKRTP